MFSSLVVRVFLAGAREPGSLNGSDLGDSACARNFVSF